MQNPETWDTFVDSRSQNPLNNDTYVSLENNAGYTSLMAVLEAVRIRSPGCSCTPPLQAAGLRAWAIDSTRTCAGAGLLQPVLARLRHPGQRCADLFGPQPLSSLVPVQRGLWPRMKSPFVAARRGGMQLHGQRCQQALPGCAPGAVPCSAGCTLLGRGPILAGLELHAARASTGIMPAPAAQVSGTEQHCPERGSSRECERGEGEGEQLRLWGQPGVG